MYLCIDVHITGDIGQWSKEHRGQILSAFLPKSHSGPPGILGQEPGWGEEVTGFHGNKGPLTPHSHISYAR